MSQQPLIPLPPAHPTYTGGVRHPGSFIWHSGCQMSTRPPSSPRPRRVTSPMEVLRTPDPCFDGLPDFGFAPHYAEVPTGDGGSLRMHYLDEGPADGPTVVLLHGEPSWSYLYRNMIPVLVDAGLRVVAPDLVGFGRSDKPTPRRRVHLRPPRRMGAPLLFDQLDLSAVNLVCQDWGGLIGLRLVGEHPDRFARVVAANTFLPTGDAAPGEAFLGWSRSPRRSRPSPPGPSSTRAAPATGSRGRRRLRRALPRRDLRRGRPPVPHPRPHLARRSRRRAPTGRRGRSSRPSTSRSSPPSPTATRSPRAPTASCRPDPRGGGAAAHHHRRWRPLPPGGQGPRTGSGGGGVHHDHLSRPPVARRTGAAHGPGVTGFVSAGHGPRPVHQLAEPAVDESVLGPVVGLGRARR